jgi:asparagine synthase (glutamine-hydrolysing)
VYHFIALVWNAADAPVRETALQLNGKLREPSLLWQSHLSTDGLSVYSLPPGEPGLRSYVLPGEAGVVLGRLFTTDLSSPRLAADALLDEHATEEIVRSGGHHLVQNYWGGYVALLRDSDRHCAYAIRDCSGKIPCFSTRAGGVTILFSDVTDLAPLELPAFTVNWRYLAALIYSSELQVRACGFNEVSEVLAGECLEIRADSTRQTSMWDPRSACRRRRIENYEEAVAELQYVVQRCIDAWAVGQDTILLSLSGGFDSAVVLGCLSRSPAHSHITCLHQFTVDACDDERRYARLAAARAGIELLEHPMDSPDRRFDERLLSAPRVPKPTGAGLFHLLELELINRVASTTGARTLWTGQGGDHVFLQVTNCLSAGDYAASHGLRTGLVGAIRDAARLSRQPYWSVFRSTWQRGGALGPYPVQADRPTYFVDPSALPDNPAEYVSHPWDGDAQDLPKGKQLQIRFLAEVMNRHRPISRYERAPQHHPLLSQPVVELCLQIPTYLLLRGGRDRALARDAFADRLPPEIIRRRDKGSIVSLVTEMIRRSESFLRELLLEGVLAGRGIIVRSDLEPYIVHGQPFRQEHYLPLMACIAAEVWARTCGDRLPPLREPQR